MGESVDPALVFSAEGSGLQGRSRSGFVTAVLTPDMGFLELSCLMVVAAFVAAEGVRCLHKATNSPSPFNPGEPLHCQNLVEILVGLVKEGVSVQISAYLSRVDRRVSVAVCVNLICLEALPDSACGVGSSLDSGKRIVCQ